MFFGFACLLRNNTLSGLMSLSFACVSHYSALPYFFVALIFSKSDVKRKLIALIPLILWFAASILVFSASDTFTRSTSFRDLSDLRFSAIPLNFLANIIYSTFPIGILSPIMLDGVKEPIYLANVFLSGFYQKTLLGFVGISLLIPLLHGLRELDRGAKLLIGFSLLFAISLNGLVDLFGLAHITLQPLAAALIVLALPHFRAGLIIRSFECMLGVLIGALMPIYLSLCFPRFDSSQSSICHQRIIQDLQELQVR